jgi:hypothetical protein
LAPLSLVSPWLAFNILSFVSLGALAASYSLLAEKKQVLAILMVTFLSISFGPNFHCLSLGQMSIWFGTGILSIGYWACLKKRFVTAGLIWSLLILKPVYLIAPGLIALSLALDKKFKLLVAIATGGLSVFAASALYFSVGVILQWLHAMRLFEQAFLKHNLELSLYEIVGVVPALTVVLPENLKVIGKIVATGVVLLLSIAFIYYLSRLFKREQSWRSALPKAMVASIVFTPLLAPYIGFYDLSIDWVAAMIILETPMATADWLYVMRFISATFMVMEIYLCLIMLAPHWQFTQPLLFLALVFFLEYKLVSRYIRSDFADRPASDS